MAIAITIFFLFLKAIEKSRESIAFFSIDIFKSENYKEVSPEKKDLIKKLINED